MFIMIQGDPPYLDTIDELRRNVCDEYQYTFCSSIYLGRAHLSPDDGVMWDISPASIGNIAVEDYPTTIEGLRDFYDLALKVVILERDTDLNPATGDALSEPQIVPRGDYARILAEFWADGPDSETPPGHWFTLSSTMSMITQLSGTPVWWSR